MSSVRNEVRMDVKTQVDNSQINVDLGTYLIQDEKFRC